MSQTADVSIIGGGLAGLTLALQLKQARQDLHIIVIERNRWPLPVAAHKVGESTVEIGAHYLAEVLGQRAHLETEHLRKFGFRCFFGLRDNELSLADELGASKEFPIPTYQIDRGILENHLAQQAQTGGVTIKFATTAKKITIDKQQHQVEIENAQGRTTLNSRWLIDSSGRNGMLKRLLGLESENNHHCQALWFRVAGHIKIDARSDSPAWHQRCVPGKRWLSTNHLMGQGYWVWLIPLASGNTSVGIVADPALHDISAVHDVGAALQWLQQQQPQCAAVLKDCRVLDFRRLKNYSYGCKQVYSDQRWALSGEAGIFTDPLYSPGSDFIAIGNTFITDLIKRDGNGESVRSRSRIYQEMYFSFYRTTLALYAGQYPGFGDSRLMALKTTWDYAYYWGILAWLYINDALSNIDLMRSLSKELMTAQLRNQSIQRSFKAYAAQSPPAEVRSRFIDQTQIPCLSEFNADLQKRYASGQLAEKISGNVAVLLELADVLENLLTHQHGPVCGQERHLLGDLRQWLAAD
jgi:flavin-dependent dehydrogenase